MSSLASVERSRGAGVVSGGCAGGGGAVMEPRPGRLLSVSVVENKDDLEERYERAFNYLQGIISGLGEKEAHDALNNAVCKDKNHEDVSLGLLMGILTEPTNASKYYRDLTLVSRDGLSSLLTNLSSLILERFLRMNDVARNQLLWLVREMIRNAVNGVDNICWNLMRYASGGDVTPKNILLIESLLDIYIENKVWLDKFPVLICSVVYTYLRLIEDHNIAALSVLRQKEVNFVVLLIRERFSDVLTLGRDFVRLLQNVARIPEFNLLWQDILLNPKSLCPSFNNVLQLLQTRTSRRFLQSRLTPDMERKLVFLTASVRFGNHKRYQEWFQRQYLATPESQSLRSDMIRFIVGVIHPTNELLCSDIIPRWAVIGWLLTTCTSGVAASNAKLALFYDWLFYEPEKDNIMNIEPAILVMHHSMRSHPAVTATLLDFLCRIIPNFYPQLTEKVRSGIYNSLRQITEKRVLPTLYPLFDSPKLDRELRTTVRETFKEFCVNNDATGSNRLDDIMGPSTPDDPAFSDDEEEPQLVIRTEDDLPLSWFKQDFPLTKLRKKDDESGVGTASRNSESKTGNEKGNDEDTAFIKQNLSLPKWRRKDTDDCIEAKSAKAPTDVLWGIHDYTDQKFQEKDRNSDDDLLAGLPAEVRTAAEKITVENITREDHEKTVKLFINVCSSSSLNSEEISNIADWMTVILLEAPLTLLPSRPDISALARASLSLLNPLFSFIIASSSKEDDIKKKFVLELLKEIHIQNSFQKIGFYLLFYVKFIYVSEMDKISDPEKKKNVPFRNDLYRDYCQFIDVKLDASLANDLKMCQETDVNMLLWLIPDIFREFKEVTQNHIQILHVIVSAIDSQQLQDLICETLQGNLLMFKQEDIVAVLTSSLSWETFEQYCLWQLLTAHNISIDDVLPILPKLEFNSHSEALTSILLMLKQERPTAEVLRQLFCREPIGESDKFVTSALMYWCQDYEEKLADLVSTLLSSRYPGTSPNKRKRHGRHNNPPHSQPSANQVLGHLEQMRICCFRQNDMSFFNLDCMRKALQQAQSNSNDAVKKEFTSLFALALEEEFPLSRRGRKVTAPPPPRRGQPANVSSNDDSEEEEIVKPKQGKRRKKALSDSD